MSRKELVETIRVWLCENNLDEYYGVLLGTTTQTANPKAVISYNLSFCVRGHTDGEIKVYNAKKIEVSWLTQNRSLPYEGKQLFTSFEDAKVFLKEHFVYDDNGNKVI